MGWSFTGMNTFATFFLFRNVAGRSAGLTSKMPSRRALRSSASLPRSRTSLVFAFTPRAL